MLSIVKVQEQTRIQNQGFLLRHQDMLRAILQIQEGKQSCQIGHFLRQQIFERFVEIGLCRRRDPKGILPQKDFV